MGRKNTLDHTALTVLRLLNRREMHGCEMIAALEAQFDLTFDHREGMLYPTLMALENQGVLEAFFKDSADGTWRLHYCLTKKGRKLLEQEAQQPRSRIRAVNTRMGKASAPAAGWFDAFCDQVLENIPRATHAEQERLRTQLRGHLEDKEAIFRTQGYEDTAQDAAIAAMGDAAAMGAAINEQLSTFWLWVGRLGWTLRVLLALAVFVTFFFTIGSVMGDNLWGNLETRWGDLSHISATEEENELWTAPLDARMELRDNVVRFHRVRLERSETNAEGYDLVLYMASYAKNPLAQAPAVGRLQRITCSAAEADFTFDEENRSVSGELRRSAAYWSERVPIEQTDGTVTITVEHYGQVFTMDIELGGGA